MRATGVSLVLLLLAPVICRANDGERLAQLEARLAELAGRVAALEAENQALRQRMPIKADSTVIESTDTGRRTPPEVPDRFTVSGDFRYRYEEIDLQGSEVQKRSRIRARASVSTQLRDDVELGFGLSTGGDSPTSSTQTLGNGGSKKDIALDLAYVDWSPHEGLHVLAGKFRNPLFQVPGQTLLWDDEWRPEGVAVHYRDDRLFATFLGTWLESDSLAPAREWSIGGHAGIYRSLGPARLTAGLGYFGIDTEGKGTFYGGDLDFAGNRFRCSDPLTAGSCVYALDYREVELFGALDVEGNAAAVKLYGHYLRNLDADRFDTGWTLGMRIRTRWQERPLQIDYFYRSLGADAVFGQLTDSDFGGGGSDAEGHVFKVGVEVAPAWQLSLSWFDNTIGADAGIARDYDRVQLDANFSY